MTLYWCRRGSFFMTVQAVIRVWPYKEPVPLMGLVQINYRKTHTFSVVWGRLSTCPRWLRCIWAGLCGLPHMTQLNQQPLSSGNSGALWCLSVMYDTVWHCQLHESMKHTKTLNGLKACWGMKTTQNTDYQMVKAKWKTSKIMSSLWPIISWPVINQFL